MNFEFRNNCLFALSKYLIIQYWEGLLILAQIYLNHKKFHIIFGSLCLVFIIAPSSGLFFCIQTSVTVLILKSALKLWNLTLRQGKWSSFSRYWQVIFYGNVFSGSIFPEDENILFTPTRIRPKSFASRPRAKHSITQSFCLLQGPIVTRHVLINWRRLILERHQNSRRC